MTQPSSAVTLIRCRGGRVRDCGVVGNNGELSTSNSNRMKLYWRRQVRALTQSMSSSSEENKDAWIAQLRALARLKKDIKKDDDDGVSGGYKWSITSLAQATWALSPKHWVVDPRNDSQWRQLILPIERFEENDFGYSHYIRNHEQTIAGYIEECISQLDRLTRRAIGTIQGLDRNTQYYLFIVLAAATNLRISEVFQLTAHDLDLICGRDDNRPPQPIAIRVKKRLRSVIVYRLKRVFSPELYSQVSRHLTRKDSGRALIFDRISKTYINRRLKRECGPTKNGDEDDVMTRMGIQAIRAYNTSRLLRFGVVKTNVARFNRFRGTRTLMNYDSGYKTERVLNDGFQLKV